MEGREMRYSYMDPDSAFGFLPVFNDLFDAWTNTGVKIPPVDVYETEKAFVIEAEVPGRKESDISVSIDKGVLKISAPEMKAEESDVIAREIRTPAFSRSFSLPDDADEGAISAESKNGILTVTIPKMPKVEPKRVEIKING